MTDPLDFSKIELKKVQKSSSTPPTSTVLNFDTVKMPVTTTSCTSPIIAHAAFIDKTDTQVPDILKHAEQLFPELFAREKLKIELQIKQLIPLTPEIVVEWGSKPMSFLAEQGKAVNTLVRDVAHSKINETIESALQSINEKPNIFVRMLARDTVLSYKPRLTVARSNVTRWLPEANQLLAEVTKTAEKLNVLLASFSAVAAYLGTIPDNILDRCVHDRRIVLQQATTQAQLLVAQVEEQRNQLFSIKTRIDQFLDVTLTAYESAKQ